MTAPALAYDTGLAAPQRTLLRNAVVTRLQPLLKKNGGFVRAIGTLPFPLHGKTPEDLGWLVTAINMATPAIVVAAGRQSMESIGTFGLEWKGELEIVLYCASSNARAIVDGRLASDVQAQTDPTADPGIEAMLEQVRQQMLGQNFGIGTTREPRMSEEDVVYTFAEYTLWEQRYLIGTQVDINPDRAAGQATSVDVASDLDGADPINPIVETITTLEAP